MIIGCTNRDSCVDTVLFELWPRTWMEIEKLSWKMRESVLFDNKECSSYARRENRERERETERWVEHSPALVALPKSAALITLNWPAPNNVTTVKCNIKIFRTFILGLSPSLHFPLVPALPISLPWPDRQMPKKRKMATKWNLPAAHTATTTKQQQRGNNFHKAKHLLYLPNGVWKQARETSRDYARTLCSFFHIETVTHTQI